MATLNDILSQCESLPVLPSTVARLTSMLNRADVEVSEIHEIVRTDDALSMTIMRYANSAQYGAKNRVFNLQESLARLGRRHLMQIVLQQQVADLFLDAGEAYGMHRGALWRSAQGGALAAECIARDHGFDDPDLAFVCGLLRDVGKLVLDKHYGSEYMTLVSEHLNTQTSFIEAERAALGFNHAELGAELAVRWGLPVRIVAAIRFHHAPPPPDSDDDDLFSIVHAADMICLWAGLGLGHDGLQYRLADHVRLKLNLSRDVVERFIAQTVVAIKASEELVQGKQNEEKCA
ncbi:MAG: HDOD domain-containing protein [Phycisphaerales bacterium]|nr:MAG: HDOD domain-containing protein [Phycisphaerales bacterium]